MSIEITIGDAAHRVRLKAFRRKVQKSGVLRELKERRHYLKPSVAKKLKEAAARRRSRKRDRAPRD
jgi:small subunit ribosomal protein S21